MAIAIKGVKLSKYYRLGVINHGMLYKDIQSWIARKTGKEDPHATLSQEHYSDRPEGFWALKGLDFEFKQGERIGIIGKNGAGKSTLLKILSRITAPTEGQAKIKGRVASLLEVGTGFHGELTGRENIYLNGAIMGMKRREVTATIDEIIAFSGIENHIDTPVKRYSSGMYVRLGFSIAAHLHSDILIADEVLAVGDATFQKNAVGKMQELSTGQGRTVLFVSHNMNSVKNLCTKGIILDHGSIIDRSEDIQELVSRYLHGGDLASQEALEWTNDGGLRCPEFIPDRICLQERGGSRAIHPIQAEKSYALELEFTVLEHNPVLSFLFAFVTDDDIIAFTTSPFNSINAYRPRLGKNRVRCTIPADLLNDRRYRIELRASLYQQRMILEPGSNSPFLYVTVAHKKNFTPFNMAWSGTVSPFLEWSTD